MYGTIEWPKIREAGRQHFQKAEACVNWTHQETETIELQSGGTAVSDRDAGQGDVFGGTKAALVVGGATENHRERMRVVADGGLLGAVDEWYIDDGQCFVAPRNADRWLRSVDMAIALFGGFREVGTECKNVARSICPEKENLHEFNGWDAGYTSELPRTQRHSFAKH